MFHVYDVPTSVAFYRDLLGFAVATHSPKFSAAKDDFGWCLLRLNGVELMLNNMYEDNIRPAIPDVARGSAHKDTTIYFACINVDDAFAALSEKGVLLRPPTVAYYGMKQLYLTDPDGYTLCFQSPAE